MKLKNLLNEIAQDEQKVYSVNYRDNKSLVNLYVKANSTKEAKDLAKYNVSAKVLEHSRDAKVTIIKKKRRKGYQRKRGHRQDLTLLQIQSISAAKTKKTAAKKPAAKKTESKK